jgi:hypothetical protein
MTTELAVDELVAVEESDPSMPTELYRYFNAQGDLLYVGISIHAMVRASRHRNSGNGWWSEAVTVTVERFPTRALAQAGEVQAIQQEKPLHNVIYADCDAVDGLSREARIVLARLSGREVSDIAREYGISRQRVDQILASARRSGKYRVGFQVTEETSGLPPLEVAKAVRTLLESRGLA